MRPRSLVVVGLLGALLIIFLRPALGAEAEFPRVFLDTAYVPPTGRILPVPAGGDFQAALEVALPGDVIALEAGATFTGQFVLPKKSGAGWIIVRTSAPDSSLPPPGTRVDPSYSAVMPKLVVPSGAIAGIVTAPGAHHFRFLGIEVKPAPGVLVGTLIGLGVRNPSEELPHNLIFDRCYIHGDPVKGGRHGIVLNSRSSAVLDSYLADFKEVGAAESLAILGWNGPGPFKIVNNYLEGAGVNVMFGGATDPTPDLVPSDIEIRHNYFAKPLSWRIEDPSYQGTPWLVKNLFELKNARRVLIDSNLFERSWAHGQVGTAVVFTVRNEAGGAPWSTVEDVTFTNNIVRHAGSGIRMHGWDDAFPSGRTKRIVIRNNLFDDISGARWGGTGRLFEANLGIEDLIIEHNTGFQDGPILSTAGGTAAVSTEAAARATFTFTGTSVSWIGFRGPQAGIARVFLDGAFVAEVDTFSTTEEVGTVVFTATGLAAASHTLTVEVTGLKNAASTDAFIVVDAFDVVSSSATPTTTRFDERDPPISYTAGWTLGDRRRAWSGAGTHTRFVFRNNLTPHNQDGIRGTGTATGIDTLNVYFPGYIFSRNVLTGGDASRYPADNFFPPSMADVGFVDLARGDYRLSAQSPYKNGGTDGKDIGADIDAIEAAQGGGDSHITPPTVTITSPTPESIVAGTITVTAAVSDNVGVAGVQFKLDGADLGTETTGAPFSISWDTTNTSNGSHTLTAVARDAAGNRATSAPITITVSGARPVTATRFEETDPSLTYTAGWIQDSTSRAWSGGTAALSTAAGARATFTFTGTSVSWIGFRGPQAGIAHVFLDGAFVAEVDTFSTTEEVRAVVFTATGLAAASHTLTITVTGLKNAASTDAFIVVDAFDSPAPTVARFQDTDPSITSTAGWIQDSTSRAWSGGTAALSTAAGARATFTFTGTSVNWIGFRGPQAGIARVFLDAAFVAEVDTFSTTEEVQAVVFAATGLAAASHVLTIEVTGLKNSASTDAYIVVDAFDVPS